MVCAVLRGSSEEARAVRDGLMLAACLPPGLSVMSFLLQLGFVLMFMNHAATKAMGMPGSRCSQGHKELNACTTIGAMVMSEPEFQL